MSTRLIERIDAVLPQTQCTQCGYPDCLGYAEALAAGNAGIDQCPPGGEAGVLKLAEITTKPVIPLNPTFGVHKTYSLALIDEAHCIGCTLCIQACPTDAILGAVKMMHTVINADCTGCELCIAPCPVDCISMVPAERPVDALLREAQTQRWRIRHEQLGQRRKRNLQERQERLTQKAFAKRDDPHFASATQQSKIAHALHKSTSSASAANEVMAAKDGAAGEAASQRRSKLEQIMARAAARLAESAPPGAKPHEPH